LARAITIGSIVLTVASLTFAVIFARKRSRIRPGFDLTRAVVGIAAILAMAAVTKVTTSTVAVVVAIAVGLALGFAQGSAVEISTGERGLYARRSPVGVVLWGAGIVTMQAAGIASRTGTVRVGQTLAWFSACLGIGLMMGRTRPIGRTHAGAGAVMIIAGLMLPTAAFIAGPAAPATAQSIQLTDEEVCGLVPVTRSTDPGIPAVWAFGASLAAVETGVAGCNSLGYFEYTGLEVDFAVYLFASEAEARRQFDIELIIGGQWYADWRQNGEALATSDSRYDLSVDYNSDNLDDFGVIGSYWSVMGVADRVAMVVGPFMLYGVADNLGFNLGENDGDGHREPITLIGELITPMVETVGEIEVLLAGTPPPDEISPADDATPTDDDAIVPPIIEPDTPPADDEEPGGNADEPIEPEEAAAQAITGLIAAAAIGLITWAEAGAAIGDILGGWGGGAGSAPPPRPPPRSAGDILLDENDQPMLVSDGTIEDEQGELVPAGRVEWVTADGVSWITREEAVSRVAAERGARIANEEWLSKRAGDASSTWMDEQRSKAATRRQAEEAAAREREQARERLDDWGEDIKKRDALVKRQELLAADSARKSSADDWWWRVLDEYGRGMQEDAAALPGELYDAFGNAVRKIHEELTDLENWRVLGETMRDSAKDGAGLIVGHQPTVEKVGGSMKSGIEMMGSIAGQLAAAAANDPAGAAVGAAKVLLGADNWAKAIDKNVPVGERFGRAIWGVFDTGGILVGLGGGALKVVDKVGDLARGIDVLGDASKAVKAADKLTDAGRAVDAAADARRAARVGGVVDTGADAGRAARAGGVVDAGGDARKAARIGEAADSGADAGKASRLGRAGEETAEAAGRGKVVKGHKGAELERRKADWARTRAGASAKVDDFERASQDLEKAMRSGNKAQVDDALAAQRKAAIELQRDKQALREINRRNVGVQGQFNKEMRAVYDKTDDQILRWAQKEHGLDDVRYVGEPKPGVRMFRDAKGREIHLAEPTNPKAGISVGADRDFTVRVRGNDGVLRDIDYRKVKPEYDRAFYEASGAKTHYPGESPEEFARRMDQAVTDVRHPESYGAGPRDLETALSQPGRAFSDPRQISGAMSYKGHHWYDMAGRYPDRYEDFMAEGMRQTTKQWRNLVVQRTGEVAKEVGSVRIPATLESAVDIMTDVEKGMLSPVEAEAALAAMGHTPTSVSTQVGEIVEALQVLKPPGGLP
jgi:hypothetical protein